VSNDKLLLMTLASEYWDGSQQIEKGDRVRTLKLPHNSNTALPSVLLSYNHTQASPWKGEYFENFKPKSSHFICIGFLAHFAVFNQI